MRRLLAASSLVGLLALGAVAHADWPAARHDAKRTAFAPGTSTITKPTRYWQIYLGGSLSGSSHVALDVNKDGVTEVVYVAGGKLLAKLPDDRLVWESPPVELTTLHGVVDLDGDGTLEVVASSPRNVFVLSGTTGAILWKQPDGEVGNVGGVRLADLDGDGNPEVLIDDCACCGISATASSTGGVYDFPAGKISTPTRIYAPSTRGHCGSSAVTLGDFDGDGAVDAAYGAPNNVIFVSGKTGGELGQSATVGETTYYMSCVAADLDAKTGDELVCFQSHYQAGGDSGGHRVFALQYDPTATPKVKTLWNVSPVPKATGEMAFVPTSLVDLDGDSRLEVVVSFRNGTKWTTSVLDARTGTSLATIDDERIVSVMDLDGDKKPEILSNEGPLAKGFVARKFERGGTPPIAKFATVTSDLRPRFQHDMARAARSSITGTPLQIDLKGDGKVLPIFFEPAEGTSPARYRAVRFDASGTPTNVATYEAPAGIALLTNQVFSKVNRSYPQLLLTRNDGYLLVLDDAFAPTNGITYGTGEFKVTLPGMRVGGFVASPIAPRLDGAIDAVVVSDSRRVLLRLDASAAWMAKAPSIKWEVKDAISPTTVPGLDSGKPGIACTGIVRDKPTDLVALSGAGAKVWARTMPSDGMVTTDPLAGDVNGDGVADVFVAYGTSGAVLNHQVHDGKTGAPVWSSPHSVPLSWGFQPFSLADHDGDGAIDLYTVPNTLRVLSGKTGAKLAENPTFLAYFTPIVDDVDGDGAPDVTMSSGYYPARTFKKDLTTTLWTGADDRPYAHGARAACAGGKSVFVQPSSQVQGLLKLYTMTGTEAGASTSLWLASGSVFTSATDAAASKKFLGTLSQVAVKADLLGTGAHPTALVGSTDGHLYAIDPCSGALDWAYDMRFAVGAPILADTSGDGVDEILAPAADGYLYALGQRVLEAPAEVNDNDPFAPLPAADLDEIATADRFAASWSAVAGADAYQVAVLTEGGSYVTQPDWVDVGNVTNVVLKGLSLSVGKKYVTAVRAISKTKGSSLEGRSDGAVVKAPPTLDGGLDAPLFEDTGAATDAAEDAASDGAPLADPPLPEASGCGCFVVPARSSLPSLSPIALALLAFVRRRR